MVLADEEQGFLKAIEANPDDEVVYLVYADWLDEGGDPRDYLLRAWLELVRVPSAERTYPLIRSLADRYRAAVEGADAHWLRRLGQFRPWVDERLAEKLVRPVLRQHHGWRHEQQRLGPVKCAGDSWVVYYWRQPPGLPRASQRGKGECWVDKLTGRIS